MNQEIQIQKQKAQTALRDRDLDGFFDIYSEDLRFIQVDGKQIDKIELLRQNQNYWSRMHSQILRTECIEYAEMSPTQVSELSHQDMEVKIRGFGIFLTSSIYKRKLKQIWNLENGEWKIAEVKMIEQKAKAKFKFEFIWRKREFVLEETSCS